MSYIQAPEDFVTKYYLADLEERNSKESRWFHSCLKEVKGEKILSLGCGPNLYDDVFFFNNIPKYLVGVDINESNIGFLKNSNLEELKNVRRNVLNHKVDTELFVGDILKFRPEWQNEFDSVYAMGVLGMLKRDDFEKVIDNIKKYLKPGGRIVDIDWTDCRLSQEKYKERESFNWYSNQGPSIKEIENIIKKAEFTIKTSEIYEVENPEEYDWGKIYCISADK